MTLQKNLMEETETLGSLLRQPYQVFSRSLYAELAKTYLQIRPAHGAVLRHLPPGGARVTDLAERAQITKQSMAYLVESLTESGFLHLTPDPADGRAKMVQFTAQGEACLRLALTLSAQGEARASARMDTGEMEQLRRLLKRLAGALEEQNA